MDKSLENNVLVIQTIQIAPFRTLMTALKDILLETNIYVETLPNGLQHTVAYKKQGTLKNTKEYNGISMRIKAN